MCSTSAPVRSISQPSDDPAGRSYSARPAPSAFSRPPTGDNMSALRLCLVTDIHHGQDSFTKKGTAALDLLADFAAFANDARPHAVIDLGDRISDADAATDARLEREVADVFRAIEAP